MRDLQFREAVGERLMTAVKKREISIPELSERTGICVKSLYNFTAASRKISFYDITRVAQALNVSLDWFAGRKQKQKTCVLSARMGGYLCSECRKVTGVGSGSDYKYCPYCGRKVVYRA